MEEIWRDIKGYEGLYQVSSYGNVRTLNYRMKKGVVRIMKQQIVKGGYHTVELSNKDRSIKRKIFLVHRLVAQAFPEICGKMFDGCEVNHKDENPDNNNANNLETCTTLYNNRYGNRIKKQITSAKTNGKHKKMLQQLDKEGNVIQTFSSALEASHIGKPGHIRAAASGAKKSAYGYRWCYASSSD